MVKSKYPFLISYTSITEASLPNPTAELKGD